MSHGVSRARVAKATLEVQDGDEVHILSTDAEGVWCHCRNSRGQEGYVLAQELVRDDEEEEEREEEMHQHSRRSKGSGRGRRAPSTISTSSSGIGESVDTEGIVYTYHKVLSSYYDPSSQSLTIDAGEVVKEVPSRFQDPEGRLFVENYRTGCRGFVPHTYLTPATELDTKTWYVGSISKPKAEELLLDPKVPNGTFLVRDSETQTGYTLAIRELKDGAVAIRHRRINLKGNMFTSWSGYRFRTVRELVRAHTSSTGGNLLQHPYNKDTMVTPTNNPTPANRSSRKNKRAYYKSIRFQDPSYHPPLPVFQPQITPSFQQQPQINPQFQQLLPITPQFQQQLQISPQFEQQPYQPPHEVQQLPVPQEEYTQANAYVYAPPEPVSQEVAPSPPLPPPVTQPKPQPAEAIYGGGGVIHYEETSSSSSVEPVTRPPTREAPTVTPGQDKWYVSPNRVEKQEKLGAGHYGEVWKAKFTKNNHILAMKTFNAATMQPEDFLNEANTMKELRHPYLVQLYGICTDPNMTFMLMEFYANGSIIDYFKRGSSMSEKQKLSIARCVSSGMGYLTSQGYIHRDLAARNVLLADDLTPKVADFGLAKLLKGDSAEGSDMKMPWKWTAPEALVGKKIWSTKCDVWSYGIFCWELYTNCKEKLYKDISRSSDLMAKLKEGYRLEKPRDCPKLVYEVLQRCWDLDFETRIEFSAIETAFADKNNRKLY